MNIKSKTVKVAGAILLALAVLGSVLFVNVEPAAAADDTETQDYTLLEMAYQRLLWALEGQSMSLDMANEIALRVQGWIDRLAGQGHDVTGLQAALDTYLAAIAGAQSIHDQAAAVLATHAGFDDDGHVIDRQQAVQTVREAGRLLRDAHRTLRDGAITLRRAIVDWRQAHRPVDEKSEVVEP